MGPERKSRVISEETRRMVAYHEAGHAVVAFHLRHSDPIHKVTIIPRGRAGGVTFTLPEDDRDEVSREFCLDSVTMAMGGRVSEKLIMDRLGSGAQSDIVQATKMVRRMVTRWGMSDKLGPVAYGDTEDQVFIGKDWGHRRDFSEATAQLIDAEVSRIIMDCYNRAEKILTEHTDELHLLAQDVARSRDAGRRRSAQAADRRGPAADPRARWQSVADRSAGHVSGGRCARRCARPGAAVAAEHRGGECLPIDRAAADAATGRARLRPRPALVLRTRL